MTNPKLLNYRVVVLHYVTVSHFIYMFAAIYIFYGCCPTRYTSHTSSVGGPLGPHRSRLMCVCILHTEYKWLRTGGWDAAYLKGRNYWTNLTGVDGLNVQENAQGKVYSQLYAT